MPQINLDTTSFVNKSLPVLCAGCGLTIFNGERVYPLGPCAYCCPACRDNDARNWEYDSEDMDGGGV
jgi:hypothetical protein